MPARVLPKFENEAEEAKWWYDNREELGAELIAASREGRLGPGARARYLQRLQQRSTAADLEPVSSPSVGTR